MFDDAKEYQLQERDERVIKTLKKKLREAEEERMLLEDQMAALKDLEDRIRDSVLRECWFKLKDLLLEDDVESLCECSPNGKDMCRELEGR